MNVFFLSLGCDKNKVDSEKVLNLFLKKENAKVVDVPELADVAIVNTCSFIRDAKKESLDWLTYLCELKSAGDLKKILVIGCLATEYYKYDNNIIPKEIADNIDVILPIENYCDSINEVNDRVCDILSFSSSIKISDGCNKCCSYCIIPHIRGKYKSNTIENIIAEVKLLAKNGVRELSIIGQDILNYGYDLGYTDENGKPIVKLVNEISNIKGIEWIRLLYCYPEEIDDSVINLIKDNKKVLHYIDMPIQHISEKILQRMNRNVRKDFIVDTINKLRNNIPDIVIRTTLIVGFPGETEEDFSELCEFIRDIKFDKLGVFAYSREKLSASYNMDNQIDDKTKESRKRIILSIQKQIVNNINEKYVGKTYKSLVEGFSSDKDSYIVRPFFNAREIDDNVYVKTNKKLISGTFEKVRIKENLGLDLVGEILI